jgi:hypothetical protein
MQPGGGLDPLLGFRLRNIGHSHLFLGFILIVLGLGLVKPIDDSFLIPTVLFRNLFAYDVNFRFFFEFHDLYHAHLIFFLGNPLLSLQLEFPLVFQEFIDVSGFGGFIPGSLRVKSAHLHFCFFLHAFQFFNPGLFEFLMSDFSFFKGFELSFH